MSSVEQFLAEVEQGCRKVDADLRRAAIDELRAHLDASVQARLELGSTLLRAEEEAVRAIGNAKQIAKALAQVHEPPKYPRAHTSWVAISCMSFAIVPLLQFHRILPERATGILSVWLILIPLVLLAYTAAKSVRLPFRGILLIAPIAAVWIAGAMASAYVPEGYDGSIRVAYRDRESHAAQLDANVRQIQMRQSEAKSLYDRFLRGENIGYREMNYRVPIEPLTVATRPEAERLWKYRNPLYFDHYIHTTSQEAAELRALDQRFWFLGTINFLWSGIQGALSFVATTLFFTLVGWTIGSLGRALRRRFRFPQNGAPG